MQTIRSRTLFALVSASALAAASHPVAAQAPADRPAAHTVKKGDTLWDLAKQYLGDPFQWPQIYKLNTDIIKDPHWIYPGQVFKLPGGQMGTAPAPAPTAEVPASVAPVAPPAAQTPPRAGAPSMTVFNPAMHKIANRTRESVLLAAPHTAVRPGDFEASPYLWSEGGPDDGGRLDATAASMGIALNPEHRPIQFEEDVFVTMPRGMMPAAGQKLLTYRLGPVLPGHGQVIVPTGVLEVKSAADAGRALATVVRKYEDVFIGNGVTPLDTLAMPTNVFPTRVEFGMSTRVLWVYTSPELPSSGNKMVLAAGTAAGLVPGDQVSLRAPGADVVPGALPAVELGVAQITRVTQWGASAVIIDARDGGIAPGLRAQVSAKMP